MPVIGASKEKENIAQLVENIPKEFIENICEIVSESIFYAMKKFEKYKTEKKSLAKTISSDLVEIKTYMFIQKMMLYLDDIKRLI